MSKLALLEMLLKRIRYGRYAQDLLTALVMDKLN